MGAAEAVARMVRRRNMAGKNTILAEDLARIGKMLVALEVEVEWSTNRRTVTGVAEGRMGTPMMRMRAAAADCKWTVLAGRRNTQESERVEDCEIAEAAWEVRYSHRLFLVLPCWDVADVAAAGTVHKQTSAVVAVVEAALG